MKKLIFEMFQSFWERLLIFTLLYLGSMSVLLIGISFFRNYGSTILSTQFLWAVCGTVFWYRIPNQVQNLLYFNLIFLPCILIYGIFADILEIDDEITGYVALLVQCTVLYFGIIKYIYKEKYRLKLQNTILFWDVIL